MKWSVWTRPYETWVGISDPLPTLDWKSTVESFGFAALFELIISLEEGQYS